MRSCFCLSADLQENIYKFRNMYSIYKLIDLSPQTQPSSEMFYSEHDDMEQVEFDKGNHLGLLGPHLPPSGISLCLTHDVMTGQRFA